jgi:hypothetical protein
MKKIPEKYEVYFYICPAHIPFHFAVHPWVVTVKNGISTRWEIIHRKYDGKERFGYVYKNFYTNPTQGIKKKLTSSDYWDATLIASLSGYQKSQAQRIVDFIEYQSPHYPYKDIYKFFPGPNSNTYIGWILKEFPTIEIKLPWNAFGKNFK